MKRLSWRDDQRLEDSRTLAEETAIALTYNRVTHAVMMATPSDLQDFAVGFSLSENIAPCADAIEDLETVEVDRGLELRMWIATEHMGAGKT